ncbi:MAG: hypothetical protein FJW88_03995 [Actinobacteria bacterium]|nr:hypothetical protein [Actinomycetota bacterium]
MDHRRLAVYLGRIRVGIGLLLLAAPRVVLRPALGRGLESPASGVVARMAGARDAVVGAGIAIAAAERRGGASWTSMGAVTDAFDAGILVLTPGLPRRTRLLGLLTAVSAVAHFRLARELARGEVSHPG